MVGYTGGTGLDPTYRNIMDHTEAILVEFSPDLVSFETLLRAWSKMHSPVRATKCQYRSAVWYLDEKQRVIAEKVVAEMERKLGGKVFTRVESAKLFYKAEDYHQHFMKK